MKITFKTSVMIPQNSSALAYFYDSYDMNKWLFTSQISFSNIYLRMRHILGKIN